MNVYYTVYTDEKTTDVEFEYHPFSDSVEALMDDIIRDWDLNELRKDEMVEIFRMKLMKANNEKCVISTDINKLDVIEMIFDHDANNLKFRLNGSDYETMQIHYRNFERGGDSYRMGITFNGHPNEIELVDYRLLKA